MKNNESIYDLFQKNVHIKSSIGGIVESKEVLVIAPHFDDEIGCAGTILRHLENGAKVTIVFITDGKYGVLEEENTRLYESLSAWKPYDVRIECWDFEDSSLGDLACKDVQKKLTQIITEIRPDIIYTTWLLDKHVDHAMLNYHLNNSLSQLTKEQFNGVVAFYEVLYPLFSNKIVNITKQIDKKIAIIEKYESQLKYLKLLDMAKNISDYRKNGLNIRSIKAAEAFFMCDKENFSYIVEKVFNKNEV